MRLNNSDNEFQCRKPVTCGVLASVEENSESANLALGTLLEKALCQSMSCANNVLRQNGPRPGRVRRTHVAGLWGTLQAQSSRRKFY